MKVVIERAPSTARVRVAVTGRIVLAVRPRDPGEEIQYILPPEVVKRKTAALQARLSQLETDLARTKEEIDKWDWWRRRYRQLRGLAQQYEDLLIQLSLHREEMERITVRLSERQRDREALEAELREARASGFLRRLFLGLDAKKTQALLAPPNHRDHAQGR